MILTHHLTAIFTLLIVAIYLIVLGTYLILAKKREELRNFKIVAIFYVIFFLVSFLLIRFTFGTFLKSLIASVWSGHAAIISNATKPTELYNLATLLSPIIEFLGVFGLVYLIATLKDRTNEKILMIVWVVVLWILSRTTLSGVAPRYLRELSVPLSILAGFAIVGILSFAQNNFQKIFAIGIIGYLIFINIVQLNVNPFLLPAGFEGMIWYRQIDQEKVDYLTSNIPPKAIVLANPSSPYLPYFLGKESHQSIIVYVPRAVPEIDEKMSLKAKRKIIDDFIASYGADYIFIGAPPIGSPDEDSFGEFVGYKKVTDFLSQYRFAQKNLVKEFRDGSKLIVVEK